MYVCVSNKTRDLRDVMFCDPSAPCLLTSSCHPQQITSMTHKSLAVSVIYGEQSHWRSSELFADEASVASPRRLKLGGRKKLDPRERGGRSCWSSDPRSWAQ